MDIENGELYKQTLPDLKPFADNDGTEYYSYQKGITTLYESFKDSCRKHNTRRYLGEPVVKGKSVQYKWLTYGEVEQLVSNIATALYYWDRIRSKSKVGIYSVNRVEWMLLDHACSSMSAVTVPIGPELADDVIVHICNETELEIIFTNNEKNLNKLLSLSSQIPNLKKIVMFDKVPAVNTTLQLASFISYKAANGLPSEVLERPNAKSWFTICYTSGTTGNPKGVIHTHGNFMAELASMLILSETGLIFQFDSKIVHFSYLLLNHIFERMVQHALVTAGGRCGFFRGEKESIIDDVKVLKPTIFVAVPKVLITIYNKIQKELENDSWKSRLFQHTLQNRIAKFKSGIIKKNLWERLVFRSITNALGGRVQAVVTGAAALDPKYTEFYQAIIGHCIEGYGQTETGGAVASTWLLDTTAGHVGRILPGMQFKLEAPEKDKEAGNNLELCLRGPLLSPGYFKAQDQVIPLTKDGWYRTGDVATFLEDRGVLQIHGRLGDIIKLCNGTFVNVAKIAIILGSSKLYSQICVTAESSQNSTVAVIVPVKGLTCDAEYIKAVLEEFKAYVKRTDGSKLTSIEVPKCLVIATEEFTVMSRELTESQKIKRFVVHNNYKNEITKAYQSLSGRFE